MKKSFKSLTEQRKFDFGAKIYHFSAPAAPKNYVSEQKTYFSYYFLEFYWNFLLFSTKNVGKESFSWRKYTDVFYIWRRLFGSRSQGGSTDLEVCLRHISRIWPLLSSAIARSIQVLMVKILSCSKIRSDGDFRALWVQNWWIP